jgi:hypothetical protein
LRLHVRRFFCDERSCNRVIFAEEHEAIQFARKRQKTEAYASRYSQREG